MLSITYSSPNENILQISFDERILLQFISPLVEDPPQEGGREGESGE
jgi:hypothetical protein